MTRPAKTFTAKEGIAPRPAALEADTLTTEPTNRWLAGTELFRQVVKDRRATGKGQAGYW